MKKFFKRLDHWVFGTVAGKIVMGFLTVYGLAVTVGMVFGYNHARELVRDARWRAEQAAEDWRGTPISRNVVFKDYRRVRGKGYVENLFEGKKTVEGVEWVRPTLEVINEPDSMAVFSRYVKGRGSRKGYLDIYSGRVMITDKFKHAWNFKNGRYAVACLDNDSLYVINRRGEIVSKRGFRLSPQIRFGFMVNDDMCIMEENNGKFGIINPEGEWVLAPEYDWITRDPYRGNYKILVGERLGLIGKDMKEILPVKFRDIWFNFYQDECETEGKGIIIYAYEAKTEDGAKEYYDEKGKLLISKK